MALTWPGKTLAATPAPLTRTIPSTGEAISAVGLGTWITFKVGDDPVLRDECADVIAAFFEVGEKTKPGGWFYARFHQLMPREGDSMPQALFVALRRAGWLVSPVVEGRLRVGGTAVRLVGVDPLTAPPSSAASEALARTDLNRFLRAETLVAGPEMAALLEANMPNPVLVDQAVAPGSVLADIGVVQKLLGRAGRISRLIVLPEQPLRQQPLADIAPDLVLQRADGATDVGRLTDGFHLNLTAFGFLSFAVGIFIVHGAIGLAFEQRRGVIRTLRALGVPLRRLVVLMIAELVVLATLAGALGIALGYL
ncbi:ABC transporter permease, partial [Mesorhizobium sp.]|uniref:FtsX-like permease family protein n=1 Tax=Mesorhizobium sp. TaxID=1871066 RepID=UPI00257C0DCB